MSKTLGNVVDPVQVIDAYSCDALRFTLATGHALQGPILIHISIECSMSYNVHA